nr:retrovirus-related Pol polyprotein from transposon TNT 1-94 [Tanacetum cinerariifolium]
TTDTTTPTAAALHEFTTIADTTATSVAFPAAAAAVVGCGWQIGHHRRVGAYKTPDFLGCLPPNHHRGGGRTTVQPPQPHLVVSGCDGVILSEASGCLKCLIIRGIFVRDKMSRDVITVGSTMRISLLYRGEYSKWRERFMNYLKEQTDGEAMINSIQNDDQPLPVIAQVSLAETSQNAPPTLKDPKQMRGSEYGEQDRKAAILYEYATFKAIEEEQLLNTYLCYLQQNQCDVNDALGYKKKDVVVTSDPLALVVEKTKVSKRKEKVVVSLDSEGSGTNDFSELKKITALLAKAFNRKKFYSKLINNNLRTSSTSQSANKKQEFVKLNDKKVEKKADEKKKDMSKVKCYNCKKEGHFAKDCKQAKIADQEVLFDKMSVELVELDKHVRDLKNTVIEKDFKISELEESKDLRPMLYDEKVIGLGYTPMFLTHSDEALEIEKFKRSRENKIEFAYDYGNLNAKKIIIDLEDEVVSLLEKEKANLKTIESLKSNGFESSENAIFESENQSENDCHVVKKECDKVENPKVIAPGMFKLRMLKVNLDTFSSVRRPKHSGVIWKKKGSSNISNVDLSSVSLSKLNKNVKRYCRKDLLSCNNSHLRKTSSASVCNDDVNVSGNSRMCDVFDENNFFIFDDESGLEVAFRKSTCFVRNEDGVDLLTGDHSLNLYTIALNEVTSNSSTCLLPKASSSQSWLWHQRLSHLNFATIINLVKNNLVQGLPKMKFEKDHLCSSCGQGKIHQKHHKSKTAFASNKPHYLLHMDLCGPMRVESINGKRY